MVVNQINLMRNCIGPRMCDILQKGLLTYFKGESVTNAMLRIRGQEGYKRYDLLIDDQTVIGWDNLLRGKFSKQWKIQQKAYVTRRKLRNKRHKEERREWKQRTRIKTKQRRNTKQKTATRSFRRLFQSYKKYGQTDA
jgi:hypothetical protein